MKKGWEIKKIGDVCEVIAGQSPEGKYYNDKGDGMPFYQGKKDFTEKFLGEPTTWTTNVTKEAQKGDILMSVRAPVGPVNFATGKVCIGRGLAAIRASKLIDKEFLFYFFLKHESEIVGNAGAVFSSINKAQIESIEIPIPSLSEQQRIVSVLDEAFASIAQAKSNAERNLVNARELFEAVLQTTFENAGEDWEEKKLEDLFSIKHGFAFKGEFFTDKGKYVLLTPGNFYEEGGYRNRGEKQKYYAGDFPKDYLLKKGDILVAMTEQAAGLLGSPIIIPESNIFLHNQRLGLIIYKEENKIDTEFLFHLFNTKRMRRLIHQSASGVKVRRTSPSKILEISAFIPPLAEQRAIVGRLEALSAETGRLEEIYEAKVEALEELKKSVLGKAFEGEL